jgi:hypothetical protein
MNLKKRVNLGIGRNQPHHRYGIAGVRSSRCNLARKFGELRDELRAKLEVDAQDSTSGKLIRQAVVEAEAVAWSTPYPLLFLPALAEEKVLAAKRWADRQQLILRRQRELANLLRFGDGINN